MSLSTSIHDIKTLVLSYHPLIVIETVEEDRVESLLISVAAELSIAHFEWSVTRGLSRIPGGAPIYATVEPLQVMRHIAFMSLEGVFHLKDFAKFLQDPSVARQFREVLRKLARRRAAVVLTGSSIELPPEIDSEAAHYAMRLPGGEELLQVVATLIDALRSSHRIRVELRSADYDALIQALSGMTLNQARQAVAYAALQDGKLGPEDVKRILDRKVQAVREGGVLEYFPVEDNRYALAGFARLKEWLERARVGFSAEARGLNLQPPKGVLMVGVQGCGKSLAIKFIAREWGLPLLKLEAGRLFEKYIGESEKNFRKAVATAESMAPVVLWIDEIEKAFAGSGGSEADGGLTRRLLGSFLTWLQEKRGEVFVAATANDLWSLPPELLRKGRFDEIFFVDLPDAVERSEIWSVHLDLRKQDSRHLDLTALVEATRGFSGAEIEQTLVASLYRALHQKRPLDTDMILQEIKGTIPLSVTRREDMERLRQAAQGRFVPVR
jgi:SpoVK/Ycf46/Vps4 family AAA+-type ATPase